MFALKDLPVAGYERVCTFSDASVGLKGVIAIHSTVRGPSAGGCRYWRYDSEEAGLEDALRLAKGMSYKNAMADLPLGGAKAVIFAPAPGDRTAFFEAYGRVVEALEGRYITAEDVGTSPDDMRAIAKTTRHVSGITSGDPSPFTAEGVFLAMQVAVQVRLGRSDMKGLKVAVQGVGHVGSGLCRHLHEAGATLFVADTNTANVRDVAGELDATVVPVSEILDVDCDVFAPCALGHAVNADAVERLKASIVCGAANNQLASDKIGYELHAKEILYAPDYVANAGGIINVASECLNWSADEVRKRLPTIPEKMALVFAQSKAQDRPPHLVADEIAEGYLKPVR